jgi:hypothetical protein
MPTPAQYDRRRLLDSALSDETKGHWDSARRTYRVLGSLFPADGEIHEKMARVMARLGRTQDWYASTLAAASCYETSGDLRRSQELYSQLDHHLRPAA